MSEIIILDQAPAILTKDSQWLSRFKPVMKQGSIIVLPPDAILVLPPKQSEAQRKDN